MFISHETWINVKVLVPLNTIKCTILGIQKLSLLVSSQYPCELEGKMEVEGGEGEENNWE
jgi:hypothetical protein